MNKQINEFVSEMETAKKCVDGFESLRKNCMALALKVLPLGSKDPDPKRALVGACGGIVDTLEWFVFKYSALEPDDIEGLIEWNEYILGKARELCIERGLDISGQLPRPKLSL